jgi:hypothetical protein
MRLVHAFEVEGAGVYGLLTLTPEWLPVDIAAVGGFGDDEVLPPPPPLPSSRAPITSSLGSPCPPLLN